jgi:hypothetical protein
MRLSTPWAIIIAALIIVAGAHLVGQSVWFALTALGTIGAVTWAIYHQGIRSWWNRPILKIARFVPEPPFLRSTQEFKRESRELLGESYYVNFQIQNTGKTIARSCQPIVTAVGVYEDSWKKIENWLPLGLTWALDELSSSAGKPTEDKLLIPFRPYFFNLGRWSTMHPGVFQLFALVYPYAQQTEFYPGKQCFEITVFGENASLKPQYFYLDWGPWMDDLEKIRETLTIEQKDHAPW